MIEYIWSIFIMVCHDFLENFKNYFFLGSISEEDQYLLLVFLVGFN